MSLFLSRSYIVLYIKFIVPQILFIAWIDVIAAFSCIHSPNEMIKKKYRYPHDKILAYFLIFFSCLQEIRW